MPKIVDHDARRDELAEALWRLAARKGPESISIRGVAEEAGWSRGIIEHYFTSKDELVAYACRLGIERTLTKVRERHAGQKGRAALRGVLLEDLRLGQDGGKAVNAWLGMLMIAGREPALAGEFGRFDEEMRSIVAQMVAEMVASGEASADIDPVETAGTLFAFNLGLAAELRLRPGSSPKAMAEAHVDAFLDAMSGARED